MPALLELRDARFAYPRRPPVLRGASLALAPGERLVITGANGAGKSTLLLALVGVLKPQSGRLLAFGTECRTEAELRALRRRVGFVFQDPDDQLFCPTVAEDVAFGPLNLGQSPAQALATVDRVLAELDLTALRDRITHKLSGGEKRLVSIAGVLAMAPEVLLLDEPTNALDEETAARLEAILLRLPQAMIIVSHDAAFRRRIATRMLRLRDGVLVPAGAG
jgi:cobalt/nickel transport system ATP-binding protein